MQINGWGKKIPTCSNSASGSFGNLVVSKNIKIKDVDIP